jgi:hypothetical protein
MGSGKTVGLHDGINGRARTQSQTEHIIAGQNCILNPMGRWAANGSGRGGSRQVDLHARNKFANFEAVGTDEIVNGCACVSGE